MNNDNFLIEEELLDAAKSVCASIKDSNKRNRAVADVLAANLAKKYFTDVDADIESGLHNSPKLLEDLDISDIYIKGNYIDVRLYFNENELCVPKSHYDLDILPVAYMFIKLDEEISSAEVTGFFRPDDEHGSLSADGYYAVSVDDLISHYEVRNLISEMDDIPLPEGFEEKIYDYFDDKVDDKSDFYKVLLKSKYAREIFVCASKAAGAFSKIDLSDTVSTADNLTPVADNEQLTDNGLGEIYPDDLSSDSSYDNFILDDFESNESVMLEESGEDGMLSEFDDDNSIQDLDEQPNNDIKMAENESNEEFNTNNSETDFKLLDENSNDNTAEEPAVDGNISEEADLAEATEEQPDTNQDDEFDVLSEFNYTTEITPSLQIEEEQTGENSDTDGEKINDAEDNEDASQNIFDEMLAETENSNNENSYASSNTEEEINNLYSEENPVSTNIPVKKKGSPLLAIILMLLLLGGGGYYAYTKFLPAEPIIDNSAGNIPAEEENSNKETVSDSGNTNNANNAMPVETVENVENTANKEEGVAVSIPAIEKNMNASILVSNLSVSWEVPSGYTTNSTAKRYFVKMGKILQLKLKTELMMLSTPPITDKIMLELDYNKNTQHFEVKTMTASSGDSQVDGVIKNTVQSTLNMGLNMNMSVFNNIQGNPILVIKL